MQEDEFMQVYGRIPPNTSKDETSYFFACFLFIHLLLVWFLQYIQDNYIGLIYTK